MLKKTRVTGTPDMARISEAVSRPGIDPRVWVSLAIVTAFDVDPAEGPFVDIILLPTMDHETARVSASYAGRGFGAWAPLEIDDEVLVCAPSGAPDEGLVVIARLWSAADPPPAQLGDTPGDALVQMQSGRTLRLAAFDGGNILLGALDAAQQAMRGNAYRTAEGTMNGTLQTQLAAAGAALIAMNVAPFSAAFPISSAAAGTAGLALNAAAAAIGTFEGQAAAFLSDNVKVK